MRPHLRLGPDARLLSPGAVDTVLVDALGVAWLEGPRLGALMGWSDPPVGALLGGLPSGRLVRAGAALWWLSDAGDEAICVQPSGDLAHHVVRRPFGVLSASPVEIIAPGAFLARRTPTGEGPGSSLPPLPECATEGRLLAWPCGGGHTWENGGLICRRPVGGPTRALTSLPDSPDYIDVGPGGALVLLIGGQALGAAPGGPLSALPDGVEIGEHRFSPDGSELLVRDEDSLLHVSLIDSSTLGRWPGPARPAGFRDGPVAFDPRDGSLRAPDGPAFALGFTSGPVTQNGDALLGPGGLCWSISGRRHRWALPLGAAPALDPDELLAAARLGGGFVIITAAGLQPIDAEGRVAAPLRLPRGSGRPLDLRAGEGCVHVLCDRAVLCLRPDGAIDDKGDAEAFLSVAAGGGRAPSGAAGGALRWSSGGLLLALSGAAASPENIFVEAIFSE